MSILNQLSSYRGLFLFIMCVVAVSLSLKGGSCNVVLV